jgi:hypothetical protein
MKNLCVLCGHEKNPFRPNEQLQVVDFVQAKFSIFIVFGFFLMTCASAVNPAFPSEPKRLCWTRRQIQQQAVGIGERKLADLTAIDVFLCDMSEHAAG